MEEKFMFNIVLILLMVVLFFAGVGVGTVFNSLLFLKKKKIAEEKNMMGGKTIIEKKCIGSIFLFDYYLISLYTRVLL